MIFYKAFPKYWIITGINTQKNYRNLKQTKQILHCMLIPCFFRYVLCGEHFWQKASCQFANQRWWRALPSLLLLRYLTSCLHTMMLLRVWVQLLLCWLSIVHFQGITANTCSVYVCIHRGIHGTYIGLVPEVRWPVYFYQRFGHTMQTKIERDDYKQTNKTAASGGS